MYVESRKSSSPLFLRLQTNPRTEEYHNRTRQAIEAPLYRWSEQPALYINHHSHQCQLPEIGKQEMYRGEKHRFHDHRICRLNELRQERHIENNGFRIQHIGEKALPQRNEPWLFFQLLNRSGNKHPSPCSAERRLMMPSQIR